MPAKTPEKTQQETSSAFLKQLKDFALTVGEECPEGHRRDPRSGACLPMQGLDHTAFTRSLNEDYGPQWRGLEDKTNETFEDEENVADRNQAVAMDAEQMDERQSCAQGTAFSFIQQRCVSLEEAELENTDTSAMTEEGQYISVAQAPGHEGVVALDPEGRKDSVGFQCPSGQFFDFNLRQCVPLNKDTVLASEDAAFTEEFKKAVATFGKVAKTSPDPNDGHAHFVTVDKDGNGITAPEMGGIIKMYSHSHDVSDFEVIPFEQPDSDYVSRHPGPVNPMEEDEDEEAGKDKSGDALEAVPDPFGSFGKENVETAAPISSERRKQLPDSAFGVPGKRKFPLDTCARVRNAMARFNQAKDLTSGEKASLRRKILARAKQCGIEIRQFARAESAEDFQDVVRELLPFVARTVSAANSTGPCPPGMEWTAAKRCEKAASFIRSVLQRASSPEVIALDPEGRRDTVNFQCPTGWLFDFGLRKCVPLSTTQAEVADNGEPAASGEVAQKRALAPNPEGRPARLPQDCPPGTVWDPRREVCRPLAPSKAAEDKQQTKADCGPEEFFNPVSKRCVPKKDAFKKSSARKASGPADCQDNERYDSKLGQCLPKTAGKESGVNVQPQNREGLVPPPAGKVKHPTDCPPGTIWDGNRRTCTPLDSREKTRKSSPGLSSPQDTAEEQSLESLSVAAVISRLDSIIKQEITAGRKEKARLDAKQLPNEAFPPSLVSATRRALMHHGPEVKDPYDSGTVDVGRLRNALARVDHVEGFATQAVHDAKQHLLYHALEILRGSLGKN